MCMNSRLSIQRSETFFFATVADCRFRFSAISPTPPVAQEGKCSALGRFKSLSGYGWLWYVMVIQHEVDCYYETAPKREEKLQM